MENKKGKLIHNATESIIIGEGSPYVQESFDLDRLENFVNRDSSRDAWHINRTQFDTGFQGFDKNIWTAIRHSALEKILGAER